MRYASHPIGNVPVEDFGEAYDDTLDALFTNGAEEYVGGLDVFPVDAADEEGFDPFDSFEYYQEDVLPGFSASEAASDPDWEALTAAGFTHHDVVRMAIPQMQDLTDGEVDATLGELVEGMTEAEAQEWFKSLSRYARKIARVGSRVIKPIATVAGGAIGAKFGGIKGAKFGANVGRMFGGLASKGLSQAGRQARTVQQQVHRRNTHRNATRVRRRVNRRAQLGQIGQSLSHLSRQVRRLQMTEGHVPPGYESDVDRLAAIVADAAEEVALLDPHNVGDMDSLEADVDDLPFDSEDDWGEGWDAEYRTGRA